MLRNLPQSRLVAKQYLDPYDTLRDYLANCNLGDISRYSTYICVEERGDILFKRDEKLQHGRAFRNPDSFYLIMVTIEYGKFEVEPIHLDIAINSPSGYSQVYPYIRDREMKRMRHRRQSTKVNYINPITPPCKRSMSHLRDLFAAVCLLEKTQASSTHNVSLNEQNSFHQDIVDVRERIDSLIGNKRSKCV